MSDRIFIMHEGKIVNSAPKKFDNTTGPIRSKLLDDIPEVHKARMDQEQPSFAEACRRGSRACEVTALPFLFPVPAFRGRIFYSPGITILPMMQPIRNIAFAHVDAGKTTLSERILLPWEVRCPGNGKAW